MTQIQVQNQSVRENARANRVNETLNREKLAQTDYELFLKTLKLPLDAIGTVAKILG